MKPRKSQKLQKPQRVLKPGHVPLERALSKLGLASRTQGRKLIEAGEVSVNGKVVRDPLREVVPERGKIAIGGQLGHRAAARTILLHKPRGVITTRSDEKGRPTVYDLLADLGSHVIPVGRLDLATTGLLLLTNDTQFAAWVTDPANAVPRVYLVSVRGEVSDETAKLLEQGIESDGERLQAAEITIRKRSGRETHLVVRLVEGKNREIRRMFLERGHEVTRLKRVSFGGLVLGELPPGRWREVGIIELAVAFPGAPVHKVDELAEKK